MLTTAIGHIADAAIGGHSAHAQLLQPLLVQLVAEEEPLELPESTLGLLECRQWTSILRVCSPCLHAPLPHCVTQPMDFNLTLANHSTGMPTPHWPQEDIGQIAVEIPGERPHAMTLSLLL